MYRDQYSSPRMLSRLFSPEIYFSSVILWNWMYAVPLGRNAVRVRLDRSDVSSASINSVQVSTSSCNRSTYGPGPLDKQMVRPSICFYRCTWADSHYPLEPDSHSPNPCILELEASTLHRSYNTQAFIRVLIVMAEVNVDFSNTGDDIIVVNYNDEQGDPQPDLVVRPQEVVRRKFPINFSFYVTFTCGRFSESATYDCYLLRQHG